MELGISALLGRYLREKWRVLCAFCLFLLILALVCLLWQLPPAAVGYAALLCGLLALCFASWDFVRWAGRHRARAQAAAKVLLGPGEFPRPRTLGEEEYQAMIAALWEELSRTRSNFDARGAEMNDYYTLWAHQIKTPLSALHLLLRAPEPDPRALEQEVFKVERYAEMVLHYLRLESLSADLILRKHPLGEIVRGTVKKYAVIFIGRDISLELGELERNVVTDEKWLGFALEQLLSNALKYTPAGGRVRIGLCPDLPGVLAVEDNGIGILAEDLPRIFDRGFTGHNGREEHKSTGIGLYLCRRILCSLGHRVWAESRVGEGSRFLVDLSQEQLSAPAD